MDRRSYDDWATDTSRMPTKHVIQIHTGSVACNLQFRDVHDRVGETWGTTRNAPAVDRNWPAMGEEILHADG